MIFIFINLLTLALDCILATLPAYGCVTAVSGEHCAIQQEVCLEPTITGKHGPEIGDRVWIGAHARIQGNIHVGNRATIGAGTIITQDIPEGCLFLGNPSRLVLRNYDNSSFL